MNQLDENNSYDAALQYVIRRYGEDWQRLCRIIWDERDGWTIANGGPLDVTGHERHEGDNHA